MAEKKFCVEYASRGTAGCKKCKQKIEKGICRIAKVVPNPFSESGGDMKQWYHVDCIFETFQRARATTMIISEPDVLEGFGMLQEEDKQNILDHIKGLPAQSMSQKNALPPQGSKRKSSNSPLSSPTKKLKPDGNEGGSASGSSIPPTLPVNLSTKSDPNCVDNSFRQFRKICAQIADEPGYNKKTEIVRNFLSTGTNGKKFEGDSYLWVKLLLPGVVKRVYNLQSKQLVKIFSQIFGTYLEEMIEDLDQGDVAETIRVFFESDRCRIKAAKKSSLSLYEVDDYLEKLSHETREVGQQKLLSSVAKRCTGNDLKMFVRLIKGDLRINCGARFILDGLDPNAYAAFQASRDLAKVVAQVKEAAYSSTDSPHSAPGSSGVAVQARLMTPVLPMLAEACRSVEQAMKKCPQGMYAEVKYDGERVQVHKKGASFSYFSRSLKPVLGHKVSHFKEFIPKAFPTGNNLILDSEVLLIDNKTGKPLPFGTLGVHKKAAFKSANVCLFVFDCIHLNGQNLMNKPLSDRKSILEKNMKEIPNRVMFSQYDLITKPGPLKKLIMKAINEGLEGLVLKDVNSLYEPGKRHWLKVKKDYLESGAMADTADLCCLGAYFGTGNKGGMMSVFLMGVYDPRTNTWRTVTKCGNGHDDATLDRLQGELDMVKISKDMSKVPSWLKVNKTLVPDFVVKDPKKCQVWEITGAEFSRAEAHTADGVSIRFPRVTKIRSDKSWKEATDLARLKLLYEKSKETSDCDKSNGNDDDDDGEGDLIDHLTPSSAKNRKHENRTRKKTLPDMFTNCKVYLCGDLDHADVMARYAWAYDGEVARDPSDATHIVWDGKEVFTDDELLSKVVDAAWLWNSIKMRMLQPPAKYRPR